jgi:hypothetical protein
MPLQVVGGGKGGKSKITPPQLEEYQSVMDIMSAGQMEQVLCM